MNYPTLDSTHRTILLILLCCFIFVVALVYAFADFDGNSSDNCAFHKDLYMTSFDSAVVVDHFVDKPNHALQTVKLRTRDNDYTIRFIPFDNDVDFHKLQTGDVIRKAGNTFEMTVNNDWSFTLKYSCSY